MIILDRESAKPLYLQIYQHIRDEIITGELEEGRRLSATRRQADNLGVSRNTVEQAYLQLCSEGYLENRRGSGYYVKHVDMSLLDSDTVSRKLQAFHRERPENRKFLYDMKYGNCHTENFPARKWRRAMEAALTEAVYGKLGVYGDNCGDWELRSYLADYLDRARGVKCSPDQLVIGSGTQQLAGILCQLIRPERCAIEEPGYDGVRHVLENHRIETAPIPVGAGGIDLAALRREKAQAVYVTPSHQFPLGEVMPIQNRMELLQLAEEQDFYVIEDDYDSIFRYTAKAVPSLQSLDRKGRVAYLGSVSKALAPSLRLAYMVLPPELKNRYDMWFSEYHNTVPSLMQDTLRIFMAEGSWEQHVRKICLANKRKHDLFAAKLERGLGPGFQVRGKGAGLHLIIESDHLTTEEMIVKCQQQGVNVYSMEKYFAMGSSRNLIMAGFGGIGAARIEDAADRILRALKTDD
ncbi:PLP-dependent aminotransferase family protein [bacterium 210820-DFI.6.37]|nr:PLP-dependent aminotransferase family protein [bacterium 210820-DFI.6.37]